MKTKTNLILCLFSLFLQVAVIQTTFASDLDPGLEQRVIQIEKALGLESNNKSMTLKERVEIIEEKLKTGIAAKSEVPDDTEKSTGVIGSISDRLTLSGAIELDYSYANDSSVSNNTVNDSTSELDVGTVALGVEANLHEYVTANVVLKGESLDTTDRIFWDEAFFTFARDDFPIYFVGGKRGQPFGTFESLFINDAITQDLYEVNKTGATVGFADDDFLGIDLSFTLYKGETLITRVNDTGYGWARTSTSQTNDVNSYIANISISPVQGLTLATYWDSEPSAMGRNDTIGGSVHLELFKFIADAEYIGALNREHAAGAQEYKESAWFVSLGYQIIDPLILAVRYEDFDADQSVSGNLDYRYGFCATYTLFTDDSFTCGLMAEYRKSEYEFIQGSSTDTDLNELFARVALGF